MERKKEKKKLYLIYIYIYESIKEIVEWPRKGRKDEEDIEGTISIKKKK